MATAKSRSTAAPKQSAAKYNLRRETASTSEGGSKIRVKSTQQKESFSFVKSQSKAVYRLINGTESTIQLIKSSHVPAIRDYHEDGEPVWDFMRYCTNQTTIWEEEQHPPFQRSQIVIEGELVVNGDTRQGRMLQEFLDKHPENGKIFKRLDPVKEAADSVAEEELILDMKLMIREMSLSTDGQQRLREIGNALGYKSAAVNEDINVIKNKMFELVSTTSGATQFRDASNDRYARALAVVEKVYKNGGITYSNNAVRWTNSDDDILRVPEGKNWQAHMAAHLASNITSELWQEFERASR